MASSLAADVAVEASEIAEVAAGALEGIAAATVEVAAGALEVIAEIIADLASARVVVVHSMALSRRRAG